MVVRSGRSWLLAIPSRYAGLTKPKAVAAIAALLVVLAMSLQALAIPDASRHATSPSTEQTDMLLYNGIVDGIRHGGNYYIVAAQSLRAGNFPLKPFVTFRLPTLAMVEALVPPLALDILLYALAAGVFAAWAIRLRVMVARTPPFLLSLLLLTGGLIAYVQPDLVVFHEIWAGLLIALSLAARSRNRWIEAVALGLMAMLIRETAALYVGIMFLLALVEGARREAAAWFGVTLVLAMAVAVHAHAVSQVVRPLDATSPGWADMQGFGLFVKAMTLSTALTLAPLAIAAPLVALALFGWSACRDDFALRVLATLSGYALLIALSGRADTFYWALLVAPLLLPGLAFAPDALRDLARAALDRRRITVTRVTR